jgi:magnesium-transporting ATPase (P-type)
MDYIRNSKNRKLKTQILGFFLRLNFWTYRLGLPGKTILFCLFILGLSLFFPWILFRKPLSGGDTMYSAFSLYVGWVGYGILISILLILFFLLSHEKKERFRAYVPFRLSDAQAVVFVTSLLGVAILSFTIASFAYTRISSQEVIPGTGLKLALSSIFLLYIWAYFFSQGEKTRAVSMSYLDKKEQSELDEYKDILEWGNHTWEKKKEGNMTLPI